MFAVKKPPSLVVRKKRKQVSQIFYWPFVLVVTVASSFKCVGRRKPTPRICGATPW